MAKDAYGDTLPSLPTEAYSLIDLQVVGIFAEGLWDNVIRAKIIRGKPPNMNAAIKIATDEQSFRRMIGYRTGGMENSAPEAMEIDHLRRAKCFGCGNTGHRARDCPNRLRRSAKVEEVGTRSFKCWNCGSEKHLMRNCDKIDQSRTSQYQPRDFRGPHSKQRTHTFRRSQGGNYARTNQLN